MKYFSGIDPNIQIITVDVYFYFNNRSKGNLSYGAHNVQQLSFSAKIPNCFLGEEIAQKKLSTVRSVDYSE